MAGSTATGSCQSRYGVQDLVGNVEEWNLDRYYSWTDYRLYPSLFKLDSSYFPQDYGDNQTFYRNHADGLVTFDLSTGADGMANVFPPLGIPYEDDSAISNPIPFGDLNYNDDYFYIQDTLVGDGDFNEENNELLGVASGGNFEDATGAGRFTLRLRKVCHDDESDSDCSEAGSTTADGTEINPSTGFRCMVKVP